MFASKIYFKVWFWIEIAKQPSKIRKYFVFFTGTHIKFIENSFFWTFIEIEWILKQFHVSKGITERLTNSIKISKSNLKFLRNFIFTNALLVLPPRRYEHHRFLILFVKTFLELCSIFLSFYIYKLKICIF